MQKKVLLIYKNHVTETLEYIQEQMAQNDIALDFLQFHTLNVLLENGKEPKIFQMDKELSKYDLYFFRTTTPYILDTFPTWYPDSQFIFPATPHKKQDKLWMMSIFHHNKLPIPKTLGISTQSFSSNFDHIETHFSYPFVLKEITGAHGEQVFLVKNRDHLLSFEKSDIINHNRPILIQELIPNDGDFRVIIAGNKYRTSFFRKGAKGDWRNNTSLGGELIQQELPEQYQLIAEDACKAVEMPLAGIDIILNKNTNLPYILEINPAFQITSNNGEYIEKANIVIKFLKEQLRD